MIRLHVEVTCYPDGMRLRVEELNTPTGEDSSAVSYNI